MANSKDKLKTLLELDELLSNPKHPDGMTMEEIMLQVPGLGSERKNFSNYIDKYLPEEYKAKVKRGKRGRLTTFRYEDPEFSIRGQVIAELNLKAIETALADLEKMTGHEVNYTMIKLFLMGVKNNLLKDHKPFMAFDNNTELKGLDYLQKLGEAIINRKPLRLRYKPFVEDEATLVVHPYFLKQYKGRWFLLALNEQVGRIHNYALDRIVSLEEANEVEYSPTNKDFNEYFDDIVGVTSYDGVQKERVLLRVSKTKGTYNYIHTKPLHWSQKRVREMDTEDWGYFSLEVKDNFELRMLLLSYGDAIEVLEPQSLREAMKTQVTNMALLYNVGK